MAGEVREQEMVLWEMPGYFDPFGVGAKAAVDEEDCVFGGRIEGLEVEGRRESRRSVCRRRKAARRTRATH